MAAAPPSTLLLPGGVLDNIDLAGISKQAVLMSDPPYVIFYKEKHCKPCSLKGPPVAKAGASMLPREPPLQGWATSSPHAVTGLLVFGQYI
ncbi:hypothetical protein UY3_07049 [Chelonia mydas]|uniref:Uncharacterized protein n=1 Tax=Chelonia mydas TaxID=8469 RepID=M7C5P3_CHEMY|nr:hypothetical protein UY3_07049 [Chelonia mydas]